MVQRSSNSLLGTIACSGPKLGGPDSKPFFEARLQKADAETLLGHLRQLADSASKGWYFLTCSQPDLTRLRIVNLNRRPAFEVDAATNYVRGQVFRVTGQSDSANINFSVPIGASLLADSLEAAIASTEESLRIVIPNRRKKLDLVEFIPDTEDAMEAVDDSDTIGEAGESAASQILDDEDFSDWE